MLCFQNANLKNAFVFNVLDLSPAFGIVHCFLPIEKPRNSSRIPLPHRPSKHLAFLGSNLFSLLCSFYPDDLIYSRDFGFDFSPSASLQYPTGCWCAARRYPQISQTRRIRHKMDHRLLTLFLHSVSTDIYIFSISAQNTTVYSVTKTRKLDLLPLTLAWSIPSIKPTPFISGEVTHVQQQHGSEKGLSLAVPNVFVVHGVGLRRRQTGRRVRDIQGFSPRRPRSSGWTSSRPPAVAANSLILPANCEGHEGSSWGDSHHTVQCGVHPGPQGKEVRRYA